MRHITSILLTAVLILSCSLPAFASSDVDVKVRGEWDFAFGWSQNRSFGDSATLAKRNGTRKNDNGIAAQRFRTQINFIASENLQGVLHFEIGEIHWGNNNGNGRYGQGSGGSVGSDGVNVETKHAYLDWMVPSTSLHLRMGLQALALPSAVIGNPAFDGDVAALIASYKINETFSTTLFWARPYNIYFNDDEAGLNRSLADEMDLIGLTLPMTFDGINLTPWGMYARVGSNADWYKDLSGQEFDSASKDATNAWWAGLALQVDLYDPLTFGLDAMYGSVGKNPIRMKDVNIYHRTGSTKTNIDKDISGRGWYIAANLNYKLDWATPGLFGWYASGDDYKDIKDGKYGRMPVLPTSNGLYGTTFSQDGAFGQDDAWVLNAKGVGTWGLGVQMADMQFVEDLSHTLRFVYHHGTNDAKVIKNGLHNAVNWSYLGHYMTDKDQAFEVNLDHKYKIYENLTANLALGWIHLDRDKDTWKYTSMDGKSGHKTDDAWKAEIAFKYKF